MKNYFNYSVILVAAVAKLSAQEKGSYKPLEWSYWQSEPANAK
jgi:hypothetical protein